MRPLNLRRHRSTSGITLVEIMISLGLGLLILLALVTLFEQHQISQKQNQALGAMLDNGRYALHVLMRDLLMAGHWGGPPGSAYVGLDAASTGLPTGSDCGVGDTPFAFALANRTEFVNNASANSIASTYRCLSSGDVQSGTDVLVTRFAKGVPAATLTAGQTQATLATGNFYIQANQSRGTLFKAAAAAYTLNAAYLPQSAPLSIWEYGVRIYHVRPYTQTPGDGIPSLCRKMLVGGASPQWSDECIAEGVQDLQLSFAIDNDSDGLPDRYLTAPTAAELQKAVSVRIEVLMRSRKPVPGYLDLKSYAIGDKQGQSAIAAANDGYFRKVYSTTVALRNTPLQP